MYRQIGRYEGDVGELVELIKWLNPAPTLPLMYNTTEPTRTAEVYQPHLQSVFPGEWTKCFLAIIWPNGSIMPHVDADTAGQTRTHLVLQSNPDCWNMNDGKWCQLETGGIYTMDQTLVHASINWGSEPRVHFIVDRKLRGSIYVTKQTNEPIQASETDARNDSGVAVEVTPEMIEAGLSVYLDWLPDDAPRNLGERELMARLFRAMLSQQPQLAPRGRE